MQGRGARGCSRRGAGRDMRSPHKVWRRGRQKGQVTHRAGGAERKDPYAQKHLQNSKMLVLVNLPYLVTQKKKLRQGPPAAAETFFACRHVTAPNCCVPHRCSRPDAPTLMQMQILMPTPAAQAMVAYNYDYLMVKGCSPHC